MTEVRTHLYRRGDISGWCGDCQLPRSNAVHDLPATSTPDRYEKDQEEDK